MTALNDAGRDAIVAAEAASPVNDRLLRQQVAQLADATTEFFHCPQSTVHNANSVVDNFNLPRSAEVEPASATPAVNDHSTRTRSLDEHADIAMALLTPDDRALPDHGTPVGACLLCGEDVPDCACHPGEVDQLVAEIAAAPVIRIAGAA